jgi:hypothetical protein
MTKNDILVKLIPHYNHVIETINALDDIDKIKHILNSYHVMYGICTCTYHLFGKDITHYKWVTNQRKKQNFAYWFVTPQMYLSHTADFKKLDLIKTLQIRVDIMSKMVKK